MKHTSQKIGFTLIELLDVIGILAILAAAVIIAVNPARQFGQARNTQRRTDVLAILNGVHQNAVFNRGTFTCAAGNIPTTITDIKKAAGGHDICSCVVTDYLSALPTDPSLSDVDATTAGNQPGPVTDCASDYVTGYRIQRDATTGRITVSAPSASSENPAETISATR
ncbi:MAG: prepilin-type N-terminal cleavage/methylation domain-containing protein [Parcubacteria group bacterium]|nr:prepilin-type N-terminal cleavage/methylation domain-containing protein [Parcubacteria group bacterium]